MFQEFGTLAYAKHGRSRSIDAENPTGEKGKGGMAPSELGPSRKGSPCLRKLPSGSVTTLADIKGPGVIITYLDYGTGPFRKGLLYAS